MQAIPIRWTPAISNTSWIIENEEEYMNGNDIDQGITLGMLISRQALS